MELALACDILVSADTATFGDTHSRWGLVPVCGLSIRLGERVGWSQAKLLHFTGRIISGTAARELGLVDQVVPAAELETTIAQLVSDILANSMDANRIVKASMREHAIRDPRRIDALDRERRLHFGIPRDTAERIGSFSNRRSSSNPKRSTS